MSQYINLLESTARARTSVPSARQLALATGVLALLMAGAAIPLQNEARQSQAESLALAAHVQAQRERLTTIGKQAAARQSDPALVREIEQTEALLALRREAVTSLQADAFGSRAGLSGYLQAFARQRLEGLWLTGFEIASGGELSISGRATDPALLPQYIRRLNAEDLLRDRRFAALHIQDGSQTPQPAAGGGSVEFALSSTLALPAGVRP
jgi:Tfp pilus assembly protein PilN